MSKAFKNGFKRGVGYALGMHVGSILFITVAKLILNSKTKETIEKQ